MSVSKKIKGLLIMFVMMGSVASFAQTTKAADDVSDKELDQFVQSYKDVQAANQEAQQDMMKMIEDEGLDVQRFQTIQQASTDPSKEVDATKEEMDSHKKITSKMQAMQPELEKKMEGIIKKDGLTMDRYQAIAMAIQKDKDLQQKVQSKMMAQQTGK